MEQPLRWNDAPTAPGERITDKAELPRKGVLMELRADTKTMENEPMLKVGESAGWTIYSDESEKIGGTGKYSPPMPMLATSIGFWLLTQVARYAHMLKMEIKNGKCHVEGDYLLHGSVVKGTVNVEHQGFRTHLEIESDEPEEKIAHLIKCAKGGCFAEKLIVQPVSLEGKVTVNGKELEI